MEQAKAFQNWMNDNGYDTVRFYPENTSAYGATDMIDCANEAVKLYDEGEYSDYQDNTETLFIEDIVKI